MISVKFLDLKVQNSTLLLMIIIIESLLIRENHAPRFQKEQNSFIAENKPKAAADRMTHARVAIDAKTDALKKARPSTLGAFGG